ncbi:hypothetical protein ALTERO38_60453 [Alteromonas sp. 38]|nr:hypothetical protein ALTER154_40343 [Alteromonas sp. 154]VXC22157.1 hypothetical protein ALTERO38_60453 [Alteromonas sp. 38]
MDYFCIARNMFFWFTWDLVSMDIAEKLESGSTVIWCVFYWIYD